MQHTNNATLINLTPTPSSNERKFEKNDKFWCMPLPKNKNFVKWRIKLNESKHLDPVEGFALLNDYGINVADYRVCNSISDVVEASKIIGFPLVIKTLTENLHHKTEVNGVVVNIKNLKDLKENYRDLEKRLGKKVLVSKMITGGIEWSIGVKNDPDFGPAVMISLGGTLIDILDEKLILMAPFSPTELQKKLKLLKSYNLLKGYRGSSEYSVKKLCEAASKVSYLALDFNKHINEIDINPIIILEDNAVAVDNVFIVKC